MLILNLILGRTFFMNWIFWLVQPECSRLLPPLFQFNFRAPTYYSRGCQSRTTKPRHFYWGRTARVWKFRIPTLRGAVAVPPTDHHYYGSVRQLYKNNGPSERSHVLQSAVSVEDN